MAKKIPKIIKEIRNNPPPPVNYAYQKNISYSQMSIFRNCAYRWKLQYKDKIKKFNSSNENKTSKRKISMKIKKSIKAPKVKDENLDFILDSETRNILDGQLDKLIIEKPPNL